MSKKEFEKMENVYEKLNDDREVLIEEVKILIAEMINSKSLSQKEVGLLCQLPQPDVSNILNAKNLNKFSYERLLIAKRQLLKSSGKARQTKINRKVLLKNLRGLMVLEISKKLKKMKKKKITQNVIAAECETLQNQISYISTINDSSYKITYDYLKKIALSLKIDQRKIKAIEFKFIK
ncbi:XRE family transcriptional regulator [Vibrio parahaemolyticus]